MDIEILSPNVDRMLGTLVVERIGLRSATH